MKSAVDADELTKIKAISGSGDIESWAALVECLRSRRVNNIEWVQGTLDLGDVNQPLYIDNLNYPFRCSELSNISRLLAKG